MTVLTMLAGVAVGARAQGRAGGPPDDPTITPGELQQMFDAYALLQAQNFLKIGDDQFTRFLPRFKALQDIRRQALQQRNRVLNDIRRLLMDPQADDNTLKDRIKQLEEIESRAEAESRKAYEAIDAVLEARQQAQFRLFEEQMERRKLELVTIARARANQQRGR